MLLGLAGRMYAGKDTVGAYLVEQHGYTKRAYATKLKEAVATLFGFPLHDIDDFKDHGAVYVTTYMPDPFSITGRQILQRMGTEVGREIFGQDFWVNQLDISPIKCVVTDVRFQNEVDHINDNNGTIIWIDRLSTRVDEHESEMLVVKNPVTITNDGTKEELYTKVDRLIDFLQEDGA
jgi:hypothetical protein